MYILRVLFCVCNKCYSLSLSFFTSRVSFRALTLCIFVYVHTCSFFSLCIIFIIITLKFQVTS